jgi:hypothetical protein
MIPVEEKPQPVMPKKESLFESVDHFLSQRYQTSISKKKTKAG